MEETFQAGFEQIEDRICAVIRGNEENVRRALICFFAEGHLLIEGVPGVAKTSLAKAIAQSIEEISQARIQFTPDLLPSDVTGSRIYQQGLLEFEEGPVFNNIVIGDEINRASPKTQSALLEVMAERQVTTDGKTRPMKRPFMCVATQNPVEHQGTYSLPEAQIDRFMMMLHMDYPSLDDEITVVADELVDEKPSGAEPPEQPKKKIDEARALLMIDQARKVYVAPCLQKYAVQIVQATRQEPGVWLGASPRGSIALVAAARTWAAANGREYTLPDDVKKLALPVLGHRVLMDPDRSSKSPKVVIEEILNRIKAPGASDAIYQKPRASP